MMTRSVQIILPSFPKTLNTIYFKGYIKYLSENRVTVYIIKFSEDSNVLMEASSIEEKHVIYGCNVSKEQTSILNKLENYSNFIVFNQLCDPLVYKLVLNENAVNVKDNYIIVFYDLNTIRESEIEWEYSGDLSKLHALLLSDQNKNSQRKSCNVPTLACPDWLTSSMFIQHLFNYYNGLKWLILTIKNEKKISIKHGNLILAIVMDLVLGYILLQYLTQDTKELSSLLMGLLEKLINMLYSLLKWLMGAPAGLKLNNAFNKMLGKYFSYHVQLWWLFLDVSGEKLDIILHLFYYLGYLGFTFQAAVISDMICIATFHSYCIYVYAARMFNIQISGLIALLRFFVGRKYNPLRKGIDTCEYTNQELFVGTVAFTVLLLLLPTTLMYYTVFTMFRVLSLSVQFVLAKLIYFIQTLPLYASILWLIRSPKVAGNVLLEVVSPQEATSLIIKLKLSNKSLIYLINNFKPPIDEPKQLVWTNFFSNVFIGKQII